MTCSKFLNIAAARGIYQSRECERILVRNIFQMQIWNMFSTHFKEKATLLKFMHRDPCVFAKSGVSHYLL